MFPKEKASFAVINHPLVDSVINHSRFISTVRSVYSKISTNVESIFRRNKFILMDQLSTARMWFDEKCRNT